MRAELGSKWRKSRASDWREISASAPAISTPVGPPPIDDERQQRLAPPRIGLALRTFERQQHAAADLERVLERLEARGRRAPLVVPEVGVRRAASRRSDSRTTPLVVAIRTMRYDLLAA